MLRADRLFDLIRFVSRNGPEELHGIHHVGLIAGPVRKEEVYVAIRVPVVCQPLLSP
jgi:hypothetical protein